MPGPYDYTINIPQPPAQNFLQSLLGIQQLKGLQQQSEIAAQQQAFAAQQQPLQLQQLQEQIAASKAQQAHTAAATGLLGVQTEETKRRNQQLADFQSEALKLADAPESWNASNLKSLAMKSAAVNPESFNAMRNLMADLPNKESNLLTSAASTTLLAVQQGKPDIAKSVLDEQIKAAEEAKLGTATTFLKAARSQLDTNPEAAALSATSFLLSANPKAFDDTLKALEAPGKMAQTAALTEEALAKAYSTKETKQVDEEKAALEKEKLRLQNIEIQQKIDAGRSDKVKIYASQNKEGYKLNEEARNATLQAEKARGILDKIDSGEVKLPTGTGASIGQWIKDKVPFLANDITFLRTQYQGLLAPEAKKMLPPGSASDADMKAAREGLLNKNATPQQFRKAVDVIAKISEDQAKYAEARLGWISENEGSIGTAVKDIFVFGVPVKKGTPLNAWWNKIGKDLDLNKLPTESAPAPAYAPPADVDAILKQFGVKK